MNVHWILIGLAAPLAAWIGWGVYIIVTTERPDYEVVRSLADGMEIRDYDAQTWISTDMESDRSAFPVLASYIFGGNVEDERIAMTAPVITGRRMSFILPEGVAADDAPAPNGQPIEFTSVPPRRVAALRFSWFASPDRVARKTERLLDVLSDLGIATVGEPFLMRYNDPGTPPFLRRTEVAVELAETID